MQTKNWIILSVAAVGIVSVGVYLNKQFKKLYNAEWLFGGIKNLRVSSDGISFTVVYNVNNEGDISVIMSEQNYDAFINGKFVAKISNKTNQKIRSNQVSQIPFHITFKPRDLINAGFINFISLMGNRDNVNILIKGFLDIKTGIIKMKKYPFQLNFNLGEIGKEKQ